MGDYDEAVGAPLSSNIVFKRLSRPAYVLMLLLRKSFYLFILRINGRKSKHTSLVFYLLSGGSYVKNFCFKLS